MSWIFINKKTLIKEIYYKCFLKSLMLDKEIIVLGVNFIPGFGLRNTLVFKNNIYNIYKNIYYKNDPKVQ